MKKALLLLTAVIILASCSKNSSTSPDNTKGNISKVEAYLTPYKFGLISPKDRILWESQEFNSKSELVLKKWRPNMQFDDVFVKNPLWSESYTLENGEIIEMIEKFSGTNRFVYTYNGANIVEVKEYGSGGIYQIEELEYINGLKNKSTLYYGNRESISRIDIFSYDGNKNLINIFRSYNSASVSDANIIYEYDNRGNVIKESYNDIDKGTTNTQKIYDYKYGDNGRVLEYIHPGPYMFEFFKDVITYDKDGSIESKIIYRSDKIDGQYEEYASVDYEYTYN